MLLRNGAFVAMCNKKNENLKSLIGQSSVIISAIGDPSIIQSEWIKDDTVLIDVSVNVMKPSHKIIGDLDYESLKNRTRIAKNINSLTTAYVIHNLVCSWAGPIKRKEMKYLLNFK